MGNNGLIDPKPDQSNALLQHPLPTEFSSTVKTTAVYQGKWGFIDSRAALARRLRKVARPRQVARPRPIQAPARGHRRPPPALPAPPQPADADGTHRIAQGSPKHASEPKDEDRSSLRRLWSSKSEIPPELESKPEVLVENRSKRGLRGNRKRKSKPEVRFEAGSARQRRDLRLRFRPYCRL